MKIFIYGDSNTAGLEPSISNYSANAEKYYYLEFQRWWYPLLNNNFLYLDGLVGRSINQEHEKLPNRNAMKTINNDLSGKNDIDLIILQLGTNDCKSAYNLSAQQITNNMKNLIAQIQTQCPAQIMLISPARFDMTKSLTKKYYAGGDIKAEELDKCYSELAKQLNLSFVSGLDIPLGIDGEHFTLQGHKILGQRVADKVAELEKNPKTPNINSKQQSKINNYSQNDIEKARKLIMDKMK